MQNNNYPDLRRMPSAFSSMMFSAFFAAAIPASQAAIETIGAGSIADAPNPDGYTCSIDYGTWIHNAGVVEPGIAGCDENLGPIGEPTPLFPQLTGPAAQKPTGTHRWWGSVSFLGEMPVADVSKAGYITPDPMTARISDRGVRLLSIPGGLTYSNGNSDIYQVPDPFSEVFDGLAVGNTDYNDLDAKLYDYSDGTMTVEWQSAGNAVMRATFVHGSPYAFFDVFEGQLELRTKAPNGPEKGIYFEQDNSLGLWTDVAGNRGTWLVSGNGPTQFMNSSDKAIRIDNTSGQMTVALLPVGESLPDTDMIERYQALSQNRINDMRVDYVVDDNSQKVTITRHYLHDGEPVETMAGLQPLHWKNAVNELTATDSIRSSRGFTKFAPLSSFTYQLPFVGVLPTLPALDNSYDAETLRQLIEDFIAKGPDNWNTKTDTYWAGKNYGKVAELAALAHSHGWTGLHSQLINWLKAELENWFNAETNGEPDVTQYFSYDAEWNTLLGYDESFGAQQQLNDHHFHYGYFVRAAAEICRVEKEWCLPENYGGMVEMLIRDYAADRNDERFPYTRNFDPANGFSWASGHANFALGNNNESTSEAANAYGAIILYGMITGNDELTDHGIYLHSTSTASYWEYWNNIDRFRGLDGESDNFAPEYDKMTTSIIWGNGHVFSTWFSPAYAHILGIQGLPLNPLVMHIGQYPDYLQDYVELGLSESANGKPSGLPLDQWRDVWWNIWAMTDASAAIADFNTMEFDYDIEAGETMAHTYHWIHAFNTLGHLQSGKGDITADSPAALVFGNPGELTYVAYNFSDVPELVHFSDGMTAAVPANSFRIKHSGEPSDQPPVPDTEAPGEPGAIVVESTGANTATLSWDASTDNVGVDHYVIEFNNDQTQSQQPQVRLGNLAPLTTYTVAVYAMDAAENVSSRVFSSFTTTDEPADLPPEQPTDLSVDAISTHSANVQWRAASDDHGIRHYMFSLYQDGNEIISLINHGTSQNLSALEPDTPYAVRVTAIDSSGQASAAASQAFSTQPVPTCSTFCLDESGSELTFTVHTGSSVDLHYTVNNGAQQNVRMISDGSSHHFVINNLQTGDRVDYFFTVIDGAAYDTEWAEHQFGSTVEPDTEAPTQPGAVIAESVTDQSAQLSWAVSSDNVGVDHYELSIPGSDAILTTSNATALGGLSPMTNYDVSVVAVDAAGNRSPAASGQFVTPEQPEQPQCSDICSTVIDSDTLRISMPGGGVADIHYNINNGGQINVRMNQQAGVHYYDISNLQSDDVVSFFITVIDGPAYDTPWQTTTF